MHCQENVNSQWLFVLQRLTYSFRGRHSRKVASTTATKVRYKLQRIQSPTRRYKGRRLQMRKYSSSRHIFIHHKLLHISTNSTHDPTEPCHQICLEDRELTKVHKRFVRATTASATMASSPPRQQPSPTTQYTRLVPQAVEMKTPSIDHRRAICDGTRYGSCIGRGGDKSCAAGCRPDR